MKHYSRRELYALGETLGESVTQAKVGGGRIYGGGGSGGGGDCFGINAGEGGSGIVIIAYKTDGSDGITTASTGGTITTSGLYTIHTFTASGTFVASSGTDIITAWLTV